MIATALPGCHKEILTQIVGALDKYHANDIYTIQAGQEYCTPAPIHDIPSSTGLHFKANLTESTKPTKDSELPAYYATNKLFGFNDCGNDGDPQNDSARVGWYWNQKVGKMEVVPFVDHAYVHHFDLSNPLAYVEIDRFYEYNIQIAGDHYVYTITDDSGALLNTITVDRFCTSEPSSRKMLFPYFGGTIVAPHKVTIDINVLD
jgi:hypothetical protein